MEPGENEWETHLTIGGIFDAALPAAWKSLNAWAITNGWKCVHLVLSRGQSPSQPMLTRHVKGTIADAIKAAREAENALLSAGFFVSRIKMEVPPWSQMVPQTAREAENLPSDHYFEHHIKLLMGADAANTETLAERAKKYGAHLSRNARRIRTDGQTERFVTQRCFGMARDQSRARLDDLLSALAPLGFPVLEVEEEFVMYDSCLALDAGWMNEKE